MQTDVLDPEAEKLFENAPFGTTRNYLNALSKRQASLKHRLQIIRQNAVLFPRKADNTILIKKQIHDIDEELKGYDHRKNAPGHWQ